MVKRLLGRAVSLLLLALVAAGGGSLPTVDALAFHEATAGTDFIPHFEASSDCHADGCSVRTVSHASRFVADLATQPPVWAFLESADEVPVDQMVLSAVSTTTYLSRAPPLSV